jgi:hypothetical protein
VLGSHIPVSPSQAAYLNRQQVAEAESRRLTPYSIVTALQGAPDEIEPLAEMLAAHVGSIAAYRTRFVAAGEGQWTCRLESKPKPALARYEVASSDEANDEVARVMAAGFRRGFPFDGPRTAAHCIVAPDAAFLVTEIDHLVSDGAALLHAARFCVRASAAPDLVDDSYIVFHRWLDDWLRSERARARRQWWEQALGDEPTFTPIVIPDRPVRQPEGSPLGARHRHRLDPGVRDLARAAWDTGRSPFQALAACVAVSLAAWTDLDEIRLSASIPNRRPPACRSAIAWTANSVPISVTARGTLADAETSARRASRLAHLHGDFPIWEVIRTREPDTFLRGRSAPICQIGVGSLSGLWASFLGARRFSPASKHRFEWPDVHLIEPLPAPCVSEVRVMYGVDDGHIDVSYDATWLTANDARALAENVAEVLAHLLRDGSAQIEGVDLAGVDACGPLLTDPSATVDERA